MTGPRYCLALPRTEMLHLVCWRDLGFGPHPCHHPCALPCHTVLMTGASLCSSQFPWELEARLELSHCMGLCPPARCLPALSSGWKVLLPVFHPQPQNELNRLTTRGHDTDSLTLVSIASRTFSDKRARSHWSCPCRHFALHCSVLCMGLRGSGSRFLLPTRAAPQSHLPGTTHAFLTHMHTQSSPQPGRAAPPLALLPDGPGEARRPHQLPGWQVWTRRARSRPTLLATIPPPTCADPKEGVQNEERPACQSSGSEPKTRPTQKTGPDAGGSAAPLVRCITQHITYLRVVKVGGHLLPCLNFMYKICMHNNPARCSQVTDLQLISF